MSRLPSLTTAAWSIPAYPTKAEPSVDTSRAARGFPSLSRRSQEPEKGPAGLNPTLVQYTPARGATPAISPSSTVLLFAVPRGGVPEVEADRGG